MSRGSNPRTKVSRTDLPSFLSSSLKKSRNLTVLFWCAQYIVIYKGFFLFLCSYFQHIIIIIIILYHHDFRIGMAQRLRQGLPQLFLFKNILSYFLCFVWLIYPFFAGFFFVLICPCFDRDSWQPCLELRNRTDVLFTVRVVVVKVK